MKLKTTITTKAERKNNFVEKETRERKIQFNQCRPFISLEKTQRRKRRKKIIENCLGKI